MLSRCLVRRLRELADELLEGEAHVMVVHHRRAQVEIHEALDHLIEQLRLPEALDLLGEAEALEDVPDGGGEALDIGGQVGREVVLVAHQLLHVERRRVDEAQAGSPEHEGLWVDAFGLLLRLLIQHRLLGRRERAVESTEDGEREDDLAELRSPIVAA